MKNLTVKLFFVLSISSLTTFALQSQNNGNSSENLEWDTILVKPASIQTVELVPAIYEAIKEQVLVREGYREIKAIPVQYVEQDETILVKEESWKWVTKKNPTTGEMEKVREIIPAEYKTIKKKVITSPTSGPNQEIPPYYETVEKKVIKTPAVLDHEEIPAEYKIVERQIQSNPEPQKWILIEYTKETPVENLIKNCYDSRNPEEDCMIWVQEKMVIATYKTVSERIITTNDTPPWTLFLRAVKPETEDQDEQMALYKEWLKDNPPGRQITKQVLTRPQVLKWVQKPIYRNLPLDSLVNIYSLSQSPVAKSNIMAWKRVYGSDRLNQPTAAITIDHPSNRNLRHSFSFIEIPPAIYKVEKTQEIIETPAIYCEIQIPAEEVAPIYEALKQVLLSAKDPQEGFTHCLSSDSEKSTILAREISTVFDETKEELVEARPISWKWVIKNVEEPCW